MYSCVFFYLLAAIADRFSIILTSFNAIVLVDKEIVRVEWGRLK
jgi:hypothetical protein